MVQLHEVGGEQEHLIPQPLLLPVEGIGATGHEVGGALPLIRRQGAEVEQHGGVIAPAGTPREVVARLNAAYVQALQSEDVKARFAAMMAEPVPSTPEQFAELIRREHARYEAVVKASGATVD